MPVLVVVVVVVVTALPVDKCLPLEPKQDADVDEKVVRRVSPHERPRHDQERNGRLPEAVLPREEPVQILHAVIDGIIGGQGVSMIEPVQILLAKLQTQVH